MSRRIEAMVVAIAVSEPKTANWPKASGVNRRAVIVDTAITTTWEMAVPVSSTIT